MATFAADLEWKIKILRNIIYNMIQRLIPLPVFVLVAMTGYAQMPQNISLKNIHSIENTGKSLGCVDQNAGTIAFAGFVGQSNDVSLDTLYFCFNDQINIEHNGDDNLTGDPDPATTPGVTYGFFNCPPTISGPNLTTVLTDPCILNNPAPPNGLWITVGGTPNGNITLSNGGQIQSFFGGSPTLVWFAPITIDNFGAKGFEPDPVTGEVGPCVNVSAGQAFAVVYLNAITASNQDNNAGVSGCRGSFDIQGGLPEFDGTSFYDISVELVTDNSVKGIVRNDGVSNGETVLFDVPVAGIYQITVADGKSCGTSFLMDMSSCTSISFGLPTVTVAPNTNICLDVTNEGGFINIASIQSFIFWNDTILQFDTIQNLNPNLTGLNPSNFNATDSILNFSWNIFIGPGISLPEGTVLFQLCFNVIGTDGECSDVDFRDNLPFLFIEVVNASGETLGFNGVNGQVCVSNSVLTVSFQQDSVSCPGEMDGSFTTTVAGGVEPYQVSWQNIGGGPIQGPFTINLSGGSLTSPPLSAGSYSVTITDSQAMPIVTIDTVEVLSPPVLSLNFNNTEPRCNGDANGSISVGLFLDGVFVNDPGNEFTFIWNTGDTTQMISGLTTGLYSLTVTAANGCTTLGNSFLAEPPPIAPLITIDTATCSGIADGGVSVNVVGGTPDVNGDYTIQWPDIGGGLTLVNNVSNISGLESNFYFLIITDDNGCIFSDSIFIPAFKVLSMNATLQNVSCPGDCNGNIFVIGSTSGGPAATPYNFDWFGVPPPPPSTDNPTNTTLSGLCEGTYSVTMQDTLGCAINATFDIIEPPLLVIDSIIANGESCQPGGDGSATPLVTGGTGAYSFFWSTNPAQTDSIATGLITGDYFVTVTDANNCTDSSHVTIGLPLLPTILSLENDSVNCSNSVDGSLTVIASPGSSPIINYNWSNGANGQTITGLSAGNYTVIVESLDGCFAIDSALVVAPPALALDSILSEKPDCPGMGGGRIAVFVSGGTPPYNYDWTPLDVFDGIGNSAIGGGLVTAGNYSVVVTDANNCTPLNVDFTLDEPRSIVVGFANIDSVSCFGGFSVPCDGTATASAGYSDGNSGLFNFSWASGESDNGMQSSTGTQLCSGFQILTVSDGVCSIQDSIYIPFPLPVGASPVAEKISCNGLSDGSIALNPIGGTPPYNILWDNGMTGPTLANLPAGSYVAVITDSKNCSFSNQTILTEPAPLELLLDNATTQNISCPGSDDGVFGVAVQGGNIDLANPVYTWGNGIGGPNSSVVEGLKPGTYSVTVTDLKGCQDSLTHSITEPPPIQFSLGDFGPIQCFGGNTFITVDNIVGGNQVTYQYFVDNGINRFPGEPSPVFAGTHTITVVDVVNGCSRDSTIEIMQPGKLEVILPNTVEIKLGDSLTRLDPQIISDLPIDSFLWSPGFQLSATNIKNPTVNAVESQQYTLSIVDINGCKASGQVFVDVNKNRNVYIPNVFSPNDDGVNDLFQLFTGLGVVNINFMKIYDRWGDLVFEATNLAPSPDGTSPGWNGKFKGDKMKPAVFLYLVEVEFLDGNVLLYKGDVTLLR